VNAALVLTAGLAFAAIAAQQAPSPSPTPPLPRDELRDEDLLGAGKLGLPDEIPGVESTPRALARARLGRRLFFDPILSRDRTVSCASCHDPKLAFATNDVRPLGIDGQRCDRNAPPIFNRALGTAHFWDGRAPTLEAQVVMPIENPHEMGLALDEAVKRVGESPDYRELVNAANDGADANAPKEPTKVTKELLAASLAEFVRRIVVADSPVDRFRAGKGDLSKLERRGLWLFESKGHCWKCHSGPNWSDESFHDTGVGVKEGEPEPGRGAVTHDDGDAGKFKTPTLRMVAVTAPYMHDGSVATLEDVVRYYSRGGNPNRNLDPLVEPLNLSDDDVVALVALLKALSRTESP
jgi:cytochrome c peroxidase